MNKNSKIITITALVVAVVSIVFALYSYFGMRDAEKQMRYDEERAFSELVSSVSKLDTAIQKAPLATTPKYASTLFAEIWKESESAKFNLSQLPQGEIDTSKVQDFISTTGDYALYMLRKTAGGEEISSDDLENVKNLAVSSEALAIEISEIKKSYNDGHTENYLMPIKTSNGDDVVTVGNMNTDNQVDQKFQEFATMVYDGPFSSHIDKLEPELTKNAKDLTEAEAKTKVARFLDTEEENIKFVGKVNTQIPFYKFTSTKEDDDVAVDITVKGGHVINFTNYREIKELKYNAEQTVEKAEDLIEEAGYDNFEKTYYTENNGIVTINFAYEQDDVIMYPDLLKVSIFKDDGTLAGVEARGYIMSHRERTGLEPAITEEQALKAISSDLIVLDEELAIIPTGGKNEVLTYEFKCENKEGKHYIVYVNAKTAQIENILILIEEENGTLTM